MASKFITSSKIYRDSGAFNPVIAASVATPCVLVAVAVAYAPVSTLTISGLIGASIALTMACPSDRPDMFLENTDLYVPGAAAEELQYEIDGRPYWDDPLTYDADVEIV